MRLSSGFVSLRTVMFNKVKPLWKNEVTCLPTCSCSSFIFLTRCYGYVRCTQRLGFSWFHWTTMIDYFSHIPILHLAMYYIIICWWRHWVDIYNGARYLKRSTFCWTKYHSLKYRWNMNKGLFHQNWFTRASLPINKTPSNGTTDCPTRQYMPITMHLTCWKHLNKCWRKNAQFIPHVGQL